MSEVKFDIEIMINNEPFKRVLARLAGSNSYEEFYLPCALSDYEISEMINRRYQEIAEKALGQVIDQLKKSIPLPTFKK